MKQASNADEARREENKDHVCSMGCILPRKEHISREEDERLMALSIIPLIPVMICIIAYFAHLESIGVIPSDQVMFSYVILLGIATLATGAGIYEIVSSFKIKRSVSFRAERFLSRTALSSAYMLGIYLFWYLFTLSLSSVLKDEYIVILSLLTASLTMAALVSHPKTRPLIKRLTQEENL